METRYYIRSTIEANFNGLFSDLARHLKLKSGDVSPSEMARIEEIKEDLTELLVNWYKQNK